MSSSRLLGPSLVKIGSSLNVELGEVKELPSLLDVLLVVGGLLGIIGITDLLVLGGSQTSRNVRIGSKLASFEL